MKHVNTTHSYSVSLHRNQKHAGLVQQLVHTSYRLSPELVTGFTGRVKSLVTTDRRRCAEAGESTVLQLLGLHNAMHTGAWTDLFKFYLMPLQHRGCCQVQFQQLCLGIPWVHSIPSNGRLPCTQQMSG